MNATALRLLLAKGLTLADAVEIAEALELDRPAVDHQAERRRAADRERARVRRQSADNPQTSPSPKDSTDLPSEPSVPRSKPHPPKSPPAEFEELWRAYPHVKGRSSKRKALAEWTRISTDTRLALPAAVSRYRTEGREPKEDCGAPAMERWLRDQRYLDWINDGELPPKIWTQAEKDAHDARILGISASIAQASAHRELPPLGDDSPGDIDSLRRQLSVGRH